MTTLTDAPVRPDVREDARTGTALQTAIAVARILMGFTFLWAFFDKVFGLGFSTPAERAWVAGGSPTTGFLTNATADSPFAGVFQALAGSVLVDWLFMLGLLGVGLSLMLGIGVRVGAIAGTAMLFFMYLAEFPLTLTGSTNPLVDYHIVDITVMAVAFFAVADQRWSFAKPWRTIVGDKTWLW
ncbi:DoxX family protein [Microbacterium sp.]|uniref:DoxX family protein n=1 Tax=Microbacterium sp. TaxID=51671 RepID=UPI003C737038